jgi:hypothetical protein
VPSSLAKASIGVNKRGSSRNKPAVTVATRGPGIGLRGDKMQALGCKNIIVKNDVRRCGCQLGRRCRGAGVLENEWVNNWHC